MKYFAYAEKMFCAHMYHTVPHAKCLGVVKIMGYKIAFHNRGSQDFSGKCNIVPVSDPKCEVYGVLYDIPEQERSLLDKDQSLGFGNQEITLRVFPVDENPLIAPNGLFAFTYVAYKDNIFEDLVPYTWYKKLILSGAKEHQLPAEYIYRLEQFSSTQDPNVHRETKQKRYLGSLLS
ncbi:MAG: gamma-glutamylcyclotransferase [Candidatus Berkiella sp.]